MIASQKEHFFIATFSFCTLQSRSMHFEKEFSKKEKKKKKFLPTLFFFFSGCNLKNTYFFYLALSLILLMVNSAPYLL